MTSRFLRAQRNPEKGSDGKLYLSSLLFAPALNVRNLGFDALAAEQRRITLDLKSMTESDGLKEDSLHLLLYKFQTAIHSEDSLSSLLL
jgi:hypothetical protein